MSAGINDRYLKELRQVLESEAELARQGTDLLADPEYRALRELFVDGDLSLAEFLARVEALAAARPEDDERSDDTEDLLDDDDDAGTDPDDGDPDGAEGSDGDGDGD